MTSRDKTAEQKSIKQKLVKTQQTIRNKFKQAYSDRIEKERKINASFKPITSKIDTLIDLSKEKKHEPAPRRQQLRTRSENESSDDSSYWWDQNATDENIYESFAESGDAADDDDLDNVDNMELVSESDESFDPEADNENNEALDMHQPGPRASKRKLDEPAGSNEPKRVAIPIGDNKTTPENRPRPELMRKSTKRVGIRPKPARQSLLLSVQPGTSNITDDDEYDDEDDDEIVSPLPIEVKKKSTGKVYVKRFPSRRRFDPTQRIRLVPPIRKSLDGSLGSDTTRVPVQRRKIIRKRISKRKTIGPKSKIAVQRKAERVIYQKHTPYPNEPQPSTSRKDEAKRSDEIETKTVRLSQDPDLYAKLVKAHGNVFRPNDEILLIEDDDGTNEVRILSPKRKRGIPTNTPRKRSKVKHLRRVRKGNIVDYDSNDSDTGDDHKHNDSPAMPIPIRRSGRVNSLNTPKEETAITEDEDKDHIRGKGIESEFIPYQRNTKIVYEHFDDPNEICDRLRLLISSKAAGNSNHSQEINSIVSELRELGLIK